MYLKIIKKIVVDFDGHSTIEFKKDKRKYFFDSPLFIFDISDTDKNIREIVIYLI